MKLISLRLFNFRQFYGKTPEIYFAGHQQNTTLIYGNNGSGKTTLLNALTWILYEKFSSAFAESDQLINKRAITETTEGKPVESWGELIFEHDSRRYQFKRVIRGYLESADSLEINYGKSELFLQVAGDDGRWRIIPEQTDDVIGKILPESLHQYFFFDGERIDQIVKSDRRNEVADATKTLLGVKVLDRAITHLKFAKKALEEELKNLGESDLKKGLKEKQKLEKELEEITILETELVDQLATQEKEKQTLSQQLLNLSGAEELQKLKIKLEQDERQARETLKEADKALKYLLSHQGYLIFLQESIDQFISLMSQWKQQGQIPTGIKQQFIDELLNQNCCLCGTELIPGTLSHNNVQLWREKAGLADIEETSIRLETNIDNLQKQLPQFLEKLDYQQSIIQNTRLHLSQTETQLDDLKEQLRRYPSEDIQQLQKQLDTLEQNLREITLELGATRHKRDQLMNLSEEQNRQLEKQKIKSAKQDLGKRRMMVTQEAIDRIGQMRDQIEDHFRLSLEQRVQEIFATISFTPYHPKLNENYELTLVETTTGVEKIVPASTGENQILSLSFIAGIVDRVREWSQQNTLMGPDSSTFPIVMDSPFGSLDEIYRRQVAISLPQLANQLIILVSKTQWRGEVEQALTPHIGKSYLLVYYSPKPDIEEDFITLKGKIYPLVKKSTFPYEYTEIQEITF